MRQNTLRLLNNSRIVLNNKQEELLAEERELLMNLSPAYLKWEEETLNRGKQESERQMIESLLEERFGQVDLSLQQTIAPLMELSLKERTHLLLNLSREELLTRFGG